MKISTYLKIAALCLTTALASPAAAANETPFRGDLQAVEVDAVQFPTLMVDGIGAGNAARLGGFTVTFQATVNLPSGAGVGSLEFIAANGDSIFAEFVGQSTSTEIPNVVSILETATITGGTGRFAGASGSFLLERTLDRITGVSSGSFDGTIIIDHGN